MKRYGELQVGITVILAIIILVAGVLWFKRVSTSRETYPVQVYLDQASGLDKGDPVEVAGVVQGKVDAIGYEKGRARLLLSINRGAELYSDARVSIANFGLMGQKFVAISPGSPAAGPLDIKKPLEGSYETGIGDMMVVLSHSVATMDTLAQRLNALLGDIDSSGGGAAIGRTLKNVERLSGNVADLTGDTREELKRAVSNFDESARELRSLLNDKGPALRSTVDNFAAASGRVDSLSRELTQLSRRIHELVDKTSSDKGNVGALLEDRKLYDRILATVARTDSLLADIQKHPRKYFKFSVF